MKTPYLDGELAAEDAPHYGLDEGGLPLAVAQSLPVEDAEPQSTSKKCNPGSK